MTGLSNELLALAQARGVATDYWDWRGNHVQVPEETIVGVLAAMDLDASTPAAAAAALEGDVTARWARMLPPSVVTTRSEGATFWVHVPHGSPVEVWVELETGTTRSGFEQVENPEAPREVEGRLVGEASFRVPTDLPLGYHRLRARSGAEESSCTLIVTPDWLGLPERLGDRRGWGFAAQLYSVRSEQSWGVGDLVDMTDLAVWSGAELGADYLLVNPLHAGEPVAPMEPSPYLPKSRRFFNPIYLRVERIPEYTDLAGVDRRKIAQAGVRLRKKLAAVDAIDRNTAWTAKRDALRLVHAAPRSAGRELDYRAFCRREGESLVDFARWSAIAETHGNDYRTWPEELQRADSAEVKAFAEKNTELVDFHMWLQWAMDEQLQIAQAKAVGAGMALGVMHDLAVGVFPGGADAWRLQDTYATGMQVGAPPDPFNQVGQDWGQPPWRPDRLAELGYAPFRDLIAGVLRHAGGVRVDHIIGLFRLWWVPVGNSPDQGTYVYYDHRAMVGVLALEAHRAGAVVVGEDLGTVEPSAREYLRQRGILGTSILWFENGSDGKPLPAEHWREYCLASVTTHDLPPTAGYLAADHVRLRDSLGLLTRSLPEEIAADEAEREAWLAELRGRGLLGEDPSVEETVQALHSYLTLTPARLLSVALPDAVGDRRTQNQPGTTDEYPNWRVPLAGPAGEPLMLEGVMLSSRAVALADVVRR
ncbi:MAG TPA: 4-alpha-glucanotransferase [Nocardioidaceae bacterium]|nr:4-alpha-glucanotransferase [Nocardioidaceae bacterium]